MREAGYYWVKIDRDYCKGVEWESAYWSGDFWLQIGDSDRVSPTEINETRILNPDEK